MKYRIVETESFQIVGIKQEFSFENGENLVGIPKLWNQVNADGTDYQLYQLNNGPVKGVLGVCIDKSDLNPKHMDYWVATAYEGKVPEGYISTKIPASKWAAFEVRGPMPEAMQRVWGQIISEWFPSSGYKHAGTAELEVYPPENAYSDDYYSEIWIPIK